TEEKGQTCVGTDASVCSASQGGSKLKTYSLLKCFALHTTLGVEAEKPLTVSKPHRVVGEVPSEGHCFGPRAEGEAVLPRGCVPAPGVEVSLEKASPSPTWTCTVTFLLESVAARLQNGLTVVVLSRTGTLDAAGRCAQAT
ncbi:hypothetical protein DBR06_SOUSAS910346, partial [Sousa chinensis]